MISLTQNDGSILNLSKRPLSIVSLVPSVTENLIQFGTIPVARTSFCIEPKEVVENIPTVGGTKTPRISKIISMKPDLVIANQEENIKAHVEEIQAAGIPVWVTFPNTVAELPKFMEELKTLCDDQPLANEWISKSKQLLQQKFVWNKKPKIITLIWKDPWMAVGKNTYPSDLITFCGGENPIEGRYPTVTVDDIRRLQPDILILPTEPYAFEHQDFEFWQSIVPRVVSFSGEDLLWSGTRWIAGVSQLVEICKHFAQKSLE